MVLNVSTDDDQSWGPLSTSIGRPLLSDYSAYELPMEVDMTHSREEIIANSALIANIEALVAENSMLRHELAS